MKILVTGAAGFIGFHVAMRLLARGDDVVGVDSLNSYYDPALKVGRLTEVDRLRAGGGLGGWVFERGNLADQAFVARIFTEHRFERVIHLAAQAGVRHSLTHPHEYVESNITGFLNVIEACRHAEVAHLTYASTSSVYGAHTKLPFREADGADHPLQFYAATKRANELTAHAYSHLFGLPTTGLRFFTVYGPWGRPDMAPHIFTKAILAGEPIRLFNGGKHTRDFTFVDDIAEGTIRASDQIAAPDPTWSSDAPDPATSNAPYRIFNIGNSTPVELADFIAAIERATGRQAVRELAPAQPGDAADTLADVSRLVRAVGYKPSTPVQAGIDRLVAWHRRYYRV